MHSNLLTLAGMDCVGLIDRYKTTMTDFLAWNPWIGTDCDNGVYTGLSPNSTTDYNVFCLKEGNTTMSIPASNGTTSIHSSVTVSFPASTTSVSIGPTMSGTLTGCSLLYTVQPGDGCSSITAQFGITFAQFYAWNPASKSRPSYI
jgi:hypothetical protein